MSNTSPHDKKSYVESAKSVKKYFDLLKEEYQKALKASENQAKFKTNSTLQRANQDDLINENARQEILIQVEKINLIQKALGKIEVGSQDAEIMILLGTYLGEIDEQIYKLKTTIKNLKSDNFDLLERINVLEKKLQVAEGRISELESDRDHFKFLYELELNGGVVSDLPL